MSLIARQLGRRLALSSRHSRTFFTATRRLFADKAPAAAAAKSKTAEKARPQEEKEPSNIRGPVPSPDFFGQHEDTYYRADRPVKFLVAMDFSQNAWRALKTAKQLFNKARGDHIVVFTVPIVPLPTVFDDLPFLPHDAAQEAKDLCDKRLDEVRIHLGDIAGQFSTEVSEPATDAREIVLVSHDSHTRPSTGTERAAV